MDEWSFTLPFRRLPFAREMVAADVWQMTDRVRRVVGKLCRGQRVPRLGAVVVGLSFYPGSSRVGWANFYAGEARGAVLDELDLLLDACVAGLVFGRVLPDDDGGRVLSRGVEVIPRRLDPYDASTPRCVFRVRDGSVLAPVGVSGD